MDRTRLYLSVLASGVAVALAIRTYRSVHTEHALKRCDIDRETTLDVEAIKNASKVVTDMIEAGKIRSLEQLGDTLSTEIAFQKIAIREN